MGITIKIRHMNVDNPDGSEPEWGAQGRTVFTLSLSFRALGAEDSDSPAQTCAISHVISADHRSNV